MSERDSITLRIVLWGWSSGERESNPGNYSMVEDFRSLERCRHLEIGRHSEIIGLVHTREKEMGRR